MSELTLEWCTLAGSVIPGWDTVPGNRSIDNRSSVSVRPYRGTSLMRRSLPYKDLHRTLGKGLL